MYRRVAPFLAAFSLTAAAAQHPWEPLVNRYCLECHDADSTKGDLDLEAALDAPLAEQTTVWENVVRQLRARQMPPLGEERPSKSDYSENATLLEDALDQHASTNPDPGATATLRRLTRTEYQNAIRDLLAVEIDAKSLLPPDQSSHGFDNITVGDLPPALLERYISAAQKIASQALGTIGDTPGSRTIRVRPDITQDVHIEGLPPGTRGGTLIKHSFPQAGEYDIKINLMRDRNEAVEGLSGKRTHQLHVLLDNEPVHHFEVAPPENKRDHTKVDSHLYTRIKAPAGPHDLGITFLKSASNIDETLRQPYESHFNYHRHPRQGPAVYQVTITGPYDPAGAGDTPSRNTILSGNSHEMILANLIHRAYRGQETPDDLINIEAFFEVGSTFEAGIESALTAILVSPKFLFRVENSVGPLTSTELASRLSFFLWSSIPDDQLLAADLTDPEILRFETRRLLADPKSESLITNFAAQWLYLRNLESITPDGRLYPDFDDNLRHAMRRETELLFADVLRDDRSILHLLSPDRTHLNERLAKHYGIPHIYGEQFRPVSTNSERGGLLRHGSLLTVTSYAHRTSPVLRGHWVLKNLLGTPPPPPPPDIPTLEDNTVDASLRVRDRLAEHRSNRACSGCHNKMDPVGLAFENYDAIGRWRELETGLPVDATGATPDGTPVHGLAELEAQLLEEPDLFARTLTEKLLTFALGRGITPSDAPYIRKIVREASVDNYKFSTLIEGIVTSLPFTHRSPAAPIKTAEH